MHGTLEPGELLRDDELIAWLGVSRTPIREALSRLSEEGLVVTLPNNSTRVAEFEQSSIDEALVAAEALRKHALRSVVGQMSPEQLSQLEGPLERLREAVTIGDTTAITLAAIDYLSKFDAATGNEALADTTALLDAHITRGAARWPDGASRKELLRAFDDLHQSVLDGDVKGAVDAVGRVHNQSPR
ncbi:hypothetical protein ASE15_03125 [Oerskovia sp. Root22]|nr:hypothetical protein ASE15_03125 [Oerskovia sp. Root22]